MFKIPALEVTNLTVTYSSVPIIANLSVTIPQGILLGIIGPNGAGKTTFVKTVVGLIKQTTGTISIVGRSVDNARELIAYIPQKSSIDWDFPATVLDMVLMGCYGRLGWFRRPKNKIMTKHMKSLRLLALSMLRMNLLVFYQVASSSEHF